MLRAIDNSMLSVWIEYFLCMCEAVIDSYPRTRDSAQLI